MAKAMRKVRIGSVVRTGADKTAVVEMVWKQRHRLYRKQVRRVARFHVHDPLNQCQLGDTIRIEEVRPISKTKRWRLLDVLERRQVADVRPMELEADAEIVVAAEESAELQEIWAEEQPVDVIEETETEELPVDEVEDIEAEESPVDVAEDIEAEESPVGVVEDIEPEESPVGVVEDIEPEESPVDEVAEEVNTDDSEPSTDQDVGDSVAKDEDSEK